MASPDPATLPALRPSGIALLVRTDFSDERSWEALHTGIRTPSEEGFLANVDIVDDEAYRNMTPAQLRGLLPARLNTPYFFFVADHMAVVAPGHPLLVVPVSHPGPESADQNEERRVEFRVIVAELWGVENNLSSSNMDWKDFAGSVGDDGVFRGF